MTTTELKEAIRQWAETHGITYGKMEISIAIPKGAIQIFTIEQRRTEIND